MNKKKLVKGNDNRGGKDYQKQKKPENPRNSLIGECTLPGWKEVNEGKDPKEVADRILSPQHERFCREYIIDENGTRAYMRAYPGSGYNSAMTSAYDLLMKPQICSKIEQLREERNKRLEITADRVLMEIAKIAFCNPQELYDGYGNLKPLQELDPDVAAVIQGVEVVGNKTVKIRLAPKKEALDQLGRHLKLFTDKFEVGPTIVETHEQRLKRLMGGYNDSQDGQ